MTAVEKLLLVIQRGIYVTEEGIAYKKDKPIRMYLNQGYYRIKTKYWVERKQRDITIQVHRIQAYHIYGDKIFEKGIVVRHLNGNSIDNKRSNIAIGTSSQNSMDIPRNLRVVQAYRASERIIKYDNEMISKIKIDRAKGLTYPELVTKYGSSKSEMWYIVNKRVLR